MTRNARWIRVAGAAALAALPLLGAGSAAAQQGTDGRWLPWLGCWEGVGAPEGSLLCILPMEGDPGVEMVSVEGGQVVSREWVRADGVRHESSREGCRGWERGRFSEDGRRIYLDADHLCGEVVNQETTGLLALLSATEWVDVRALAVRGEAVTGVSRYRLAPSDVAEAAGFGDVAADRAMAVRAARVAAAGRLAPADVIDASRHVHPDAVGAWIAARGEPFRLDAAQLVRMADAGVPPQVIDVVVAVSYPRHFTIAEGARVAEIERPQAGQPVSPYPERRGRPGRFWDPFYGYYGPGYGAYGGWYDGYYGYPGAFRPTVVIVEPAAPQREGGRVVNGRGYSQSRPATPAPSSARAPAAGSGSSAPPAEPAPASGEGSSSTGRTAQPRPPG